MSLCAYTCVCVCVCVCVRGGAVSQKKKKRGGEKNEDAGGNTGRATSARRLQVNQTHVLGDKLLKYAASDGTLVNQVCGGYRGVMAGVYEWGEERRRRMRDALMKGKQAT